MNILNYSRRAALWLFWPALAIIVWGELTPSAPDPFDLWDKLLHFTAYFGLSGLAWVALGGGRRGWLGMLGLIAFGGLLELVQGAVGRDVSFADELANTLGVVMGGLAGLWFLALSRLVGSRRAD